jgi:phosphatidylglycerophosphate synthase
VDDLNAPSEAFSPALTRPASPWRHVPNALSIARIAAAPVLVGFAVTGEESAFAWLLVLALLSDIVDGLIARALGLQSELGAKLDSIGDMLVVFAALAGIGAFHPVVYRDHWPGLATFLGAGLLEYLLALWRYGRLSSFHTLLSKAAGTLLALFLALLFVNGFLPWLFYLAIGLGVLASLEEMLLIAALPGWRANVRGLWWLQRR